MFFLTTLILPKKLIFKPNFFFGKKFILADAGYEVWLGNNRGNTYSNTNENYSYNDKNFWTFSWDEMANIDLPTQINVCI